VLGDYTDAELVNIVETNVLGVMLGCREVRNALEKKRKEKTTPFGVNLMRSPVLYRAAQGRNALCLPT